MFNPEIKTMGITSNKSGDFNVECGGGCNCYVGCYCYDFTPCEVDTSWW